MAKKFRKKPVVIEALQLRWNTWSEVCDFAGVGPAAGRPHGVALEEGDRIGLVIPTLEGAMVARENDWIIKGVKGEVYPCKPDIFEATYEPVEDGKTSHDPRVMLVFDNEGECTPESMEALLRLGSYGGARDRPYDGQPWTGHGERGSTMVAGLTMRDVGDCIARGAVMAGEEVRDAVIRAALCEIEKMMGIYPNVPRDGVAHIPMLTIGPPPEPPEDAS